MFVDATKNPAVFSSFLSSTRRFQPGLFFKLPWFLAHPSSWGAIEGWQKSMVVGNIYHLYTTYILPIGWLYITYHLLGEPESTIEKPPNLTLPPRNSMPLRYGAIRGSSFTKKYLVEAMVPGVSIWHQPKQGTSKGTSLKTTIYLHQVRLLPNGLIQWSWWQSYFLLFESCWQKKNFHDPQMIQLWVCHLDSFGLMN